MSIKKTDNFFVISNYQHDPTHLLDYCDQYIIYEQTNINEIIYDYKKLNVIHSKHSGHNISDYFQYFIDNYENLPETIALIKGNVFPRHLSKDYFNKVYNNKYYTFLFYDQKLFKNKSESWTLISESEFLEINNSWYVESNPHLYFRSLNSLLKFIFKNPLFPEKILFSPGACYIINKYQVLKYPKEFYRNLIKLITYTNPINPFPSEAHQIERLMHTIFTSSYQPEKHMLDSNEFDEKIASIQPKLSKILLSNSSPRLKKVINFFELSAQSDEISILEIGIYQPSDMTRWGKILKNKFNLTGLGLADFKHNTPNGTYFSGSTLNRLDEILVEKNNFNLVIYEGNFFSGEALTLIEKIADKIHCQGFFALLDVPANYIFWMKKIIHLLKVKDVVFKIEFVEVDYLNEKQKIILITMKKNIFFNKQYYRLINYIELTKLRIMTKTY